MVAIEIIGNLGADAEVVNANGAQFVAMRVADNRKVNGQEHTQWYKLTLNRVPDKLMQYLKKGQSVFARGVPRFGIYDSAQHHCKMVDVTIMVNEIQLVGAAPQAQPAQTDSESTGEQVPVF